MQITSAMKMVSAKARKHKMRSQCALCRKINEYCKIFLLPTLEGDAGGEYTTQRDIKRYY
jgi:F-type H+-transporting ATPase subunit gamma